MILKILHLLLRWAKHTTIHNCFRDKYLTRWHLLRTNYLALMLHYFHRSDEDRALHDHPWSFITILLWRGYYEHTQKEVCKGTGKSFSTVRSRKWPGFIMWRPAEWRHRVELIDQKPAVTLVIRLRRRRVWGYHLPDGFMPHDQWWTANCE